MIETDRQTDRVPRANTVNCNKLLAGIFVTCRAMNMYCFSYYWTNSFLMKTNVSSIIVEYGWLAGQC